MSNDFRLRPSSCTLLLAVLLLAAASVAPGMATALPRAAGVWQQATAAPKDAALRRADFPADAIATARFGPLEHQRAQPLRQPSRWNPPAPLRIGVGRLLDDDASRQASTLTWVTSADGGQVARMRITSPAAHALRARLVVRALPDGTELRVLGSAAPARIVGPQRAAGMRKALGGGTIYWSPVTDGDTQTLAWYLPPGSDHTKFDVRLTGVSHMLTSAAEGFAMPSGVCDDDTGPYCAASCEVDVACEEQLGDAFDAAVNAVTLMTFMVGDDGYLCTATLLADTTGSHTPYLYSAAHCLSDQASASTVDTLWFVQNSHCGGTITLPPGGLVERAGGADLLYADAASDVLLLRMRDTPPAGSYFAGWDANRVPIGSDMIEIHHPKGDAKKVSHGQVDGLVDVEIEGESVTLHGLTAVSYSSGIAEGGSSGSALFTAGADGNYELRGGLCCTDTEMTCAVVGQPSSSGNTAAFSRFDLAYPQLASWLAPDAGNFRITPGITGNWYDPSQSGHGFSIEVLDGDVMLLDWYVFEPGGGPTWISAIGAIDGDSAVLDAAMKVGGGARFPPHFDAGNVHNQAWGAITVRFDDCNHGTASWQPTLAGYPAGSMPIERLTLPAGLSCP
jgi:hypothetical protein